MDKGNVIRIVNAAENNLKSVSLDIPLNKLVVVTGVSGSGKSSLIFDVLYREAEFRYLGTFSAFARQFLGKMKRPDVEQITGISPAVAVDQYAAVNNPRSTVGTMTGIHDILRLLFARTRVTCHVSRVTQQVTRGTFSFNTPQGACPQCKGLGVEDRLDPSLLIEDPEKSIRQRCMTITTPNGYIMYSQVTLDVLDEVCRAEGFTIDIPWKDLTDENRYVIFYGSDKIEIPFGKHPLESRMKWSGITAKPREMGVYKGIIPVMEEILKRDRNKNILRFVRTSPCSACGGSRFNPYTLSVRLGNFNIAELLDLPVNALTPALKSIDFSASARGVADEVIQRIEALSGVMKQLGLGHLSCSRESGSLSAGESRRLKLATQLGSGLSGLLYVFDEPSIGLHHTETLELVGVLKRLRDEGNTVIVVEHDEEFIRHADHIIDIGPGPGIHGGNVLLNCPVSELKELPENVIRSNTTLSCYFGLERMELPVMADGNLAEVSIMGASHHNLKNIDVAFLSGAINVVTGVSGSGKASLVHQTLGSFLKKKLHGENAEPGAHEAITGWEQFKRVIEIDQSPIGRTPRSNPATYTGLFDHIRDLFASLVEAIEKGFVKGRFSFNTGGGRCADCEGAGYKQTGMHFMGNVEIVCERCNGRRFDDETLEVRWKGKNIFEVLEMPVSEAMLFFEGEKKILRYLEALDELGLGYLTLGQRSSTLSGGESQRVRLAAELLQNSGTASPKFVNRASGFINEIVNRASGFVNRTLYVLDSPTTGLHNHDVKKLLACLNRLVSQGNTVICIEHHTDLLRAASMIIELGPGSGSEGGEVVFAGRADEYFRDVAYWMQDAGCKIPDSGISHPVTQLPSYPVLQPSRILHPVSLMLKNVSTHNLKGIDVEIPHRKFTVITGVSGSGKSSLAYDTIHAEARNRFLGNFPAYARSRIGMKDKPDFESVHGLLPTFALEQSGIRSNPRSTVGTFTGIYDLYRLLYSRAALPLAAQVNTAALTSADNSDQSSSCIVHRPSYIHERTSSILHPESYIVHRPSYIYDRPFSTLFSFNNIHGACTECDGLGVLTLCDRDKLISKPGLSVLNGAMDQTKSGKFYGDPFGQYVATLKAVGEKHGIDYSRPWNEISEDFRRLAMDGCGEETYDVSWEYSRGSRRGTHHFTGQWKGLLNLVNEEYARKHADHRGEGMMNVMSAKECRACNGSRLNTEALSWQFAGKNIAELSSMSVSESMNFFKDMVSADVPEVAAPLITEILRRLDTLAALGLPYLTASRSVESLSHGESRRLQLAAQTGSGLSGMIYVLDEPTAGLHSRDTSRLLSHIRELVKSGNTVIAVEHDREMILGADHIIDMGPGAGLHGGEIVAEGSQGSIMDNENSVTGPYLKNPESQVKKIRRQMKTGLSIKNAFVHNLKNFDLEIPSGGIVCITGASGSGKSSLVFDLIHTSWQEGRAVGCSEIMGFENFSKLVPIEHGNEFNSPLAVVATYSGAFELIRNLYGGLEDAKSKGLSKSHFSFLTAQGRCPACEGMGRTRISMDFMPDVYQECEVCSGKRFRSEVLEVKYNGKNIADVLEAEVSEAVNFFMEKAPLRNILSSLADAGLSYLKLGQALNTLSGGEARRLNLCRMLVSGYKMLDAGYRMQDSGCRIQGAGSGNQHSSNPVTQSSSNQVTQLPGHPASRISHPGSLYLFDEPSTGLHFRDIENLLRLFNGLADAGNTLLIIEHDPQIIAEADHVIELGPEGGEKGGYLVSVPREM